MRLTILAFETRGDVQPLIPRPRLTAGNLAAAIEQAVGEPDMSRRAADLGARIRAEDGMGAAVEIIEAFLFHRPIPTR